MMQPDPECPGMMWDKPYPPTYYSPMQDCRIDRWIVPHPLGADWLITSSLWEHPPQWVQSPRGAIHQRVLLLEFDQTLSLMQ